MAVADDSLPVEALMTVLTVPSLDLVGRFSLLRSLVARRWMPESYFSSRGWLL